MAPPAASPAASPPAARARTIVRVLLAAGLVAAGVGHLTWLRVEFQAQVPEWLPLEEDLVVVVSGVVEIALGTALLLARSRRRLVGWATAAFFVVIFPGNIAQYVEGVDAFGLDSDAARAVRLLFQPVLVVMALWSTGAWPGSGRKSRAEVSRTTEGTANE